MSGTCYEVECISILFSFTSLTFVWAWVYGIAIFIVVGGTASLRSIYIMLLNIMRYRNV